MLLYLRLREDKYDISISIWSEYWCFGAKQKYMECFNDSVTVNISYLWMINFLLTLITFIKSQQDLAFWETMEIYGISQYECDWICCCIYMLRTTTNIWSIIIPYGYSSPMHFIWKHPYILWYLRSTTELPPKNKIFAHLIISEAYY